ncbi:hypothetical protein C8K36_102491 [Rhodococcus sp. OK519]|nr:hypothetical protein C8K36_102491 [Rhodococcus sp. OK519]
MADVDSPIDLVPVEPVEPSRFGLYTDDGGDRWQKCPQGWTFTGYADGSPPIAAGHVPIDFSDIQHWGPFAYAGGERNELGSAAAPYRLEQVVTILHSEGINTGLRRLKQYLNTGVCWTDGFNNPREGAADYLVVVKKSSPGRDAVVRVTVAGVAKLVELMGAKK